MTQTIPQIVSIDDPNVLARDVLTSMMMLFFEVSNDDLQQALATENIQQFIGRVFKNPPDNLTNAEKTALLNAIGAGAVAAVAAAAQAAQANQGRITVNEGQITTNEGRITTNEANINALIARVDAIENPPAQTHYNLAVITLTPVLTTLDIAGALRYQSLQIIMPTWNMDPPLSVDRCPRRRGSHHRHHPRRHIRLWCLATRSQPGCPSVVAYRRCSICARQWADLSNNPIGISNETSSSLLSPELP